MYSVNKWNAHYVTLEPYMLHDMWCHYLTPQSNECYNKGGWVHMLNNESTLKIIEGIVKDLYKLHDHRVLQIIALLIKNEVYREEGG